MIKLLNNNKQKPYVKLRDFYHKAIASNQKSIEAISISSYDPILSEVTSRYVNLKIIDDNKFIFFTNYNSPKSRNFLLHDQISAIFFWDTINVQIRIKAKIKKTSIKFNKQYFQERSCEKNALAISSNQSKTIDSYNQVRENYDKTLKNDDLKKCPEYWGGYSFTPYYFEFWEGHELRINKREAFDMIDGIWKNLFLQP